MPRSSKVSEPSRGSRRPTLKWNLGETPSRGLRARLLLVITNLLAIGCLAWTLRHANLSELWDDLATMDWKWVAVAVATGPAAYLWQALRWRLVLRPVVRLGFWHTVRALYIGLFVNEVLPVRAGELLRCYVLSRGTKELPFSVAFSSVVIERVFDGIWLGVGLMLTLHFVVLPRFLRYLVDGAYVLGGVVLAGAVIMAIAMLRRRNGSKTPGPKRKGWRGQFDVLMDDLGLIGHSRFLYLAFFQSLPYLLIQAIPIWASFKGYGFDLSIFVGFGLLVFIRLGSVVPQAPANLGIFQFLTTQILQNVFDVVPAEAARFSLVLWAIVTLPLMIGGFIALSAEEADIIGLKRAAEDQAAGLRTHR